MKERREVPGQRVEEEVAGEDDIGRSPAEYVK